MELYKATPFLFNKFDVDPDLVQVLYDEFLKLEGVIQVLAEKNFAKTYVEPSKYADGDVYYADGTEWDPGSGEGLYIRLSTGWSKL